MSTNTGGLPPLKPATADEEGLDDALSHLRDDDGLIFIPIELHPWIGITLVPDHADGDFTVKIEADGVQDGDEAIINILEAVIESLRS